MDFNLTCHGSIYILTPVSEAAKVWADDHLPHDATGWGHDGIVVEARYIEAVVNGIQGDGLDVQM